MSVLRACFVILVAACDAGVPGPGSVPPSVPPPTPVLPSTPAAPPDPIVNVAGHSYAVVQSRDWRIECSNAGGTHWTFTVDGMGPDYFLHGGGHGIYRPSTLPAAMAGRPMRDGPADAYHVAEIRVAPELVHIQDPGWCIGDLPPYAGFVLAVLPATDLATARARLAAIPREGFTGAAPIGLER